MTRINFTTEKQKQCTAFEIYKELALTALNQ